MVDPHSNEEALRWTQDCLRDGRYVTAVHFEQRLAERDFIMDDIRTAVANADEVRSYEKGSAINGGTCWRITGKNVDGDRDVSVGIETYVHKHKRRVCICTVIDTTKEDT